MQTDGDSARPLDHSPAFCYDDFTVEIPLTPDLTEICTIKRDFRRMTNKEGEQHPQLAVLVCVKVAVKKKQNTRKGIKGKSWLRGRQSCVYV